MSSTKEDNEAPPSYAVATGSSTASSRPTQDSAHLQVPQKSSVIPLSARRSMEDELRPLPKGWIRQFDEKEQHQFFVDTKAKPERAIWTHPYDDETYLKSLTSEERERIQEEEHQRTQDNLSTYSSDAAEGGEPSIPVPPPRDEKKAFSTESPTTKTTSRQQREPPSSLPPRPQPQQKKSFGRKLKDKVTGTTHEEREQERIRRAQQEREYYEAHQQFRRALQRAQMTGEPQLLGKDKDGKDVYIEPPGGPGVRGGSGYYGGGGYGYNPYAPGNPYARSGSAVYSDPNARFIRPQMPYSRPGYGYGYGYGHPGYGIGAPLALGLGGGLLFGGLLGAGL